MIIYLGIGSNIEPASNLPKALKMLGESVTLRAVSTHFRTAPLAGRTEQSDYINGVWEIETELSFQELKAVLRGVESACGRVRSEDRFASRPADLDILIFGEYIDSDLYTRPFLAFPLQELAPDLVLETISLRSLCDSLQPPQFPDSAVTEELRRALPAQPK